MRIFLVGPGGVGKTTVGEKLAEMLDYQFVDLDKEFTSRIGHIDKYNMEHGYNEYSSTNSKLCKELLTEYECNVVMPVSSGFLVHEGLDELVKTNINLLKENGRIFCLLPHINAKLSAKISFERRLKRGYENLKEVDRSRVYEKYIKRHKKYSQLGFKVIYSMKSPEEIALAIVKILNMNIYN